MDCTILQPRLEIENDRCRPALYDKGFSYLLDVGSPGIDAGDPLIEDGIADWRHT